MMKVMSTKVCCRKEQVLTAAGPAGFGLRFFFRVSVLEKKNGELPEWPNGPDSKSGVPETVPGVRIPRSPPLLCSKCELFGAELPRETRPTQRSGAMCLGINRRPVDTADAQERA